MRKIASYLERIGGDTHFFVSLWANGLCVTLSAWEPYAYAFKLMGIEVVLLGYTDVSKSTLGVVHAWVGQIVLNCNVFKTIFERPTGTRVEVRSPALGGHGRP